MKQKILIIGVGGLGCTTASLLARQGYNLVLIDGDIVEKSNLDRQILFFNEDIGRPKVEVAEKRLSEFCNINAIFDNFNDDTIQKYETVFKELSLIIDCTDNVEVRKTINEFSYKKLIPWIYSAGVQDVGSLYFIDPTKKDRACYECFNENKYGESACEVGVLNTTVSIIGSLSARMTHEYMNSTKYDENMIRLKGNQIYNLKIKVNGKCKNHTTQK